MNYHEHYRTVSQLRVQNAAAVERLKRIRWLTEQAVRVYSHPMGAEEAVNLVLDIEASATRSEVPKSG